MSTTIEQRPLAVLTPAEQGALNEAFKIPDVTAIDIDRLDDHDLVTFAKAIAAQRELARAKFVELCAPVDAAIAHAESLIKSRIVANGGTALAHDTFIVRLEQRTVRDKRIDVLRRLEGLLPDDEYAAAIYEEVKREWKADLRKLDLAARKYGGEIAAIVAEGAPRVDVGVPQLIIEPRPAALKAIS
jgi:hypothetical protein